MRGRILASPAAMCLTTRNPDGTPSALQTPAPRIEVRMSQNVQIISECRSVELPTRFADDLPKSDIPLERQCGLLRYGRLNGTHTMFYRPRCGSRRCVHCRPHVVTKKMTRISDEVIYGQITTAAAFANGLRAQLARARKRGDTGDYMRIPVSSTQILIVSDAEIGFPIHVSIIKQYMLDAVSAWGSITSSEAWRAKKLVPSGDFVDEGVVTVSVAEIAHTAKRLGLRPYETAHSVSYRTTPAQHWGWRMLAKVCTYAEYWDWVGRRRVAA